MKAVILAAGLCKRIRQVTGSQPKCLLQVGGRAILDYQLESLFGAGINSVAIEVGYGERSNVTVRAREGYYAAK
jgi:choline kinase